MVNTKLVRVSNAGKFAISIRYCNRELPAREGKVYLVVREDQLK